MREATFEDFSKAVRDFFQLEVNPLRARFDFSIRKQREGVTAAKFLGALRTLLIDCEISDQGEYRHILAQQLAHGCRSQETLRKLLAVGELDPDKLFKVMQDEERSGADAAVMHHGVVTHLGRLVQAGRVAIRVQSRKTCVHGAKREATKPSTHVLTVEDLATTPMIQSVPRETRSVISVTKWATLHCVVGARG